jgi:hypothetical protein
MTTWTVAGLVVGEAGPGLWIRMQRVLMPDGRELSLQEEPVYFLRWERVMTALLYTRCRRTCGGSGEERE